MAARFRRVDASRLSAIPLFDDLTESELAVVADAASETTADEGQTLVTAGDFGHGLYAIEAGTATVNAGWSEALRQQPNVCGR
jgi:CRP-like cAMP-binding protein